MDDHHHETIKGDAYLLSRETVPLSLRNPCTVVKKRRSWPQQNPNSRGSHRTKSLGERILEYISVFFSRKNESETITKPHRSRGKNQESEANGMRSVPLLAAIPAGVEDAPKFKGKKIGGARSIIASSSL